MNKIYIYIYYTKNPKSMWKVFKKGHEISFMKYSFCFSFAFIWRKRFEWEYGRWQFWSIEHLYFCFLMRSGKRKNLNYPLVILLWGETSEYWVLIIVCILLLLLLLGNGIFFWEQLKFEALSSCLIPFCPVPLLKSNP